MKRRTLSRAGSPGSSTSRASVMKAAAALGRPMAFQTDMTRASSLPNAKASRLKHPQHQGNQQQHSQNASPGDANGLGITPIDLANARKEIVEAYYQPESQVMTQPKAPMELRDSQVNVQATSSPFMAGRPPRRPSTSRLSRGGSCQSSSSLMSPAASSLGPPSPNLTQKEVQSPASLAPASSASNLRSPFSLIPPIADSSSGSPRRSSNMTASNDAPLTIQSLRSHDAQADSFGQTGLSNTPEHDMTGIFQPCSSMPVPHSHPSIVKPPLPEYPARGFVLARPSRLSTMSSDAETAELNCLTTSQPSTDLTMDEILNRARIEYQREAAAAQAYQAQAHTAFCSTSQHGPSADSSAFQSPETLTASWLSSISSPLQSSGSQARQWRLPLGLFPSSLSEAAESLPADPNGYDDVAMTATQSFLTRASLQSADSDGFDENEDLSRKKEVRSLDSGMSKFTYHRSLTLPIGGRLRSVTESYTSLGSHWNHLPGQLPGQGADGQQPDDMSAYSHTTYSSPFQSSTGESVQRITSPFAMSRPGHSLDMEGSGGIDPPSDSIEDQEHLLQFPAFNRNFSHHRGLQRQFGQTFPQPMNGLAASSQTAPCPDISPSSTFRGFTGPEDPVPASQPLARSASMIQATLESSDSRRSSVSGSTSNAVVSSFSELVQEIAVMKKLAHPNIVKLHEVCSLHRTCQSSRCLCISCHQSPCLLLIEPDRCPGQEYFK